MNRDLQRNKGWGQGEVELVPEAGALVQSLYYRAGMGNSAENLSQSERVPRSVGKGACHQAFEFEPQGPCGGRRELTLACYPLTYCRYNSVRRRVGRGEERREVSIPNTPSP